MSKFLNDEPLEYRSSNGTVLKCLKCDLSVDVDVNNELEISKDELLSDYLEFGAWHALNIHSQLNGFVGYSRIKINKEIKLCKK